MSATIATMQPTIQELTAALHASWGADTCFDASEWSTDNPARGQCVVSSLIVQDYIGGELLRYEVGNNGQPETHYCNQLPDGTILDTTGSQYRTPVTLRIKPIDLKGHTNVRAKRLADDETCQRYELLKQRVADFLSSL